MSRYLLDSVAYLASRRVSKDTSLSYKLDVADHLHVLFEDKLRIFN